MIEVEKVTIGQFIDYCQLVEKLKPQLDRHFKGREDINSLEIFLHCPEYVEEIVKFWTGWATVKDKDMDMVLGLFSAIEKLSVVPDAIPVHSFKLENEWYYAPQDVQFLKKSVSMGKATFSQALEALQIEQLMNGNQEMIPYVLAVVFLREGETVDDINISLRAETLRRLPVTTAMNAYFF
jgi:hypothetical protein